MVRFQEEYIEEIAAGCKNIKNQKKKKLKFSNFFGGFIVKISKSEDEEKIQIYKYILVLL